MTIELLLAIAGFVIATLLAVAGWLIAILLNMILREITLLKARDSELAAAVDNLGKTAISREEHVQALTDIRNLIAGLRGEVQNLVNQLLQRGNT